MSSAVQPDQKPAKVATWSALEDRQPAYALVADVDLVVVRYDDQVSVLYGRCLHRGALMSDGHVDGDNLICGVHQWDYRLETGVSEYDNDEVLEKFTAWIDAEDDAEPFTAYIKELAQHGLEGLAHHGNVSAMGIALTELPRTDDIQLLTGQFARKPLLDDAPVATEVIIGPQAAKPLRLEIPVFVSDMSFGALSEEAKVALAQGAELAGTGICSGEGGMLPEEQAANSRYFYELASGYFGWGLGKVARCQAFHFKGGGQGARHWRPPARSQGARPGRRHAGYQSLDFSRFTHGSRLPRNCRAGARSERWYSDRSQNLGPAH